MAREKAPIFLTERALPHLERDPDKVYIPEKFIPEEPIEPIINLKKLQDHLTKVPLDDISKEVILLTYGEMITFAEEILRADSTGKLPPTIDADAIAKIMHCMAVSRLTK